MSDAAELDRFTLINVVDGCVLYVSYFSLCYELGQAFAGISEALILSVLTQCQTDPMKHNLCGCLQCCKSPDSRRYTFLSHL